jgi:hypothetical protein
MKKWLLMLLVVPVFGSAQERTGTKVYLKSASEFIFSLGMMEASVMDTAFNRDLEVDPVVRFSGFFHLQEQLHIDFGRNFGIYTGLGLRNIGMINKLNDSIRVKQRVYSIGIPLALKVGKLPGGWYAAAGAEGEFFIHYKQKDFYDDEKRKFGDWFSDRVNLVNPSVFLDINSNKGSYIRFKYYLNDFLVKDKQQVNLGNGNKMAFFPEKSQLFYVAIGTTVKHKSKPTRSKVVKANTAWLNGR